LNKKITELEKKTPIVENFTVVRENPKQELSPKNK
jgi:hypothetical protein